MLKDYTSSKSNVVNQFLHDNGLCGDFCVVLAQYDVPEGPSVAGRKLCLGLDPLTKEAEFYWGLKGGEQLLKALQDYETKGKRHDFSTIKGKNNPERNRYCRSCATHSGRQNG